MMSSSRLKPSLTPLTLFATRARMRPWKARVLPSSSLRVKATTLFSTFTSMPATTVVRREPFGPFTVTTLSSWRTSTPLGSVISFLPIRDMGFSLPDLAEDFAADAILHGIMTREHALRGGDDGQSQAAEHPRDLLLVAVDAAPRPRDTLDAVDDGLAVYRILEIDAERRLRRFFIDHGEIADESLALEDAGDLHLELRGRKLDTFVVRHDSVPNPGQHVCNRVCHGHSYDSCISPESSVPSPEVAVSTFGPGTPDSELIYQLALVTPGI